MIHKFPGDAYTFSYIFIISYLFTFSFTFTFSFMFIFLFSSMSSKFIFTSQLAPTFSYLFPKGFRVYASTQMHTHSHLHLYFHLYYFYIIYYILTINFFWLKSYHLLIQFKKFKIKNLFFFPAKIFGKKNSGNFS